MMQTVVTQASSQRQTVSSRQESITASKVTKAFSSSSTITKTTRVASGHVPKTPQHSVDVESIPPPKEPERKNSLVHGTSNANFKKKSVKSTAVQAVVVTSVKSEQTISVQTPTTMKPKSEFGVQIPHKSPLPERSTKLKEVPIPKVPTAVPASVSAATAAASTASAASSKVASPTTEASTEPKPVESKLIRLGK